MNKNALTLMLVIFFMSPEGNFPEWYMIESYDVLYTVKTGFWINVQLLQNPVLTVYNTS